MSVILHEERDACGLTLIVSADLDPIDPRRDFDHLCTLVCWHRRYDLGDKHTFETPEAFRAGMAARPHTLLPVFLYDHSGITIATTPFSCPWDSGQIGWIFVELLKLRAEFAGVSDPAELQRKAEALMRAEIAEYDQYLTGNVWCARIEDCAGAVIDICCGFFGSDYAIEEGRRMLEEATAAFRREHGEAFAAQINAEQADLLPPA